jgi:glycerol-3-phosphate cytidylyltransferase
MKTGFTCGAFDLFHAGHNIFLRDAKKYCDYLMVGLHTDPTIDRPEKNKPIQTIYERYVQLKNCAWVDEIIPYDTEADLLNVLATNEITVRFLGADYLGRSFTGDKLCDSLGIDIFYLNRYHNFSSSELRKRLSNDPTRKWTNIYQPISKGGLL